MSFETEGNIINFVYKLLENEPQSPKSITLEIDSGDNNIETGFKCLIDIFTIMMKFLHGDQNGQVCLANLTEDEINVVSNYFKSFGFNIYIEISQNGNKIYSNYNYELGEPEKENKLSNHCLTLNSEGKTYKIFFDFL